MLHRSILLMIAVLGSAAVPAVQDTPKDRVAAAAPSAGMRAYIDPATGKLSAQPAPGSRPELVPPELVPDDSKLEFMEMPDGTKGVLFHGQRQATMIATLESDGSISTKCIEGTGALPDSTSQSGHD